LLQVLLFSSVESFSKKCDGHRPPLQFYFWPAAFGATRGKRRIHQKPNSREIAACRPWLENAPPNFAAIPRGRADNRLIGYCGFFHQEVDGTNEIKIGYRLHPNYWNKGLATEAAQAVRDHAFRDLNLSRVISLIHPENAASRRVAEKIRMQFEHKTVFKGFPALVFMISRERWLTNRAA